MTGTLTAALIAAMAFVGSHFLMSNPPLRPVLVGALGDNGFLLGYSLVSFITLVWMIIAWRAAPYVELWPMTDGSPWAPILVMPVASILLVAGNSTPNPASIRGGKAPRIVVPPPGILTVTRHPTMWAISLWAASHVAANGDAASLILFGALMVLALVGTRLLDMKRRRRFGPDYDAFLAATSNVPLVAILDGRARLRPGEIGWARFVGGLVLYAVLLFGHPYFAGVPVLP